MVTTILYLKMLKYIVSVFLCYSNKIYYQAESLSTTAIKYVRNHIIGFITKKNHLHYKHKRIAFTSVCLSIDNQTNLQIPT